MIATPVQQRFVVLDGIRGVAAVAIVHRHAEFFFGRPDASSYLAVDLFFALSGFVLAHAYGERLRCGDLSVTRFMAARVLRLYPLYLIALAVMSAFFLMLYAKDLPTPIDDLHRMIDLKELAFALMTGLLFVPSPVTLTLNGALFLVSPAWSLFNELVANLVYARFGVRARPVVIGAIVVVSALVLCLAAWQLGKLHAGFRWREMYAGMARVFFSFFVGVLIYRYQPKSRVVSNFLAAICLAVVCLVLAVPITDGVRPIVDLVVVLLVWPVLLLVASRTEADGWVGGVSRTLGTASYGLYVLHVPLLAWVAFLMPWLGAPAIAAFAGWTFIAVATFVAFVVTVGIDQPTQSVMKHRLLGRRLVKA